MTYRGNTDRATNLIEHRAIKLAYYQLLQRCKKFKFKANKVITISEFAQLKSRPCYYCESTSKRWVGLDRIDNKKGYQLDNVIPCCRSCNVLRSDQFTVTETKFLVTVLKLYRSCINDGQKRRLLNWISVFQ